MTISNDCTTYFDPERIAREGTSREQRVSPALDPAGAPVDERVVEHQIVFAQAYARFLRYFDGNNVETGDWTPFFSEGAAVQLAIAAVQDVTSYRQSVREYLSFLNDRRNRKNEEALRDRLDYLFSCCATLAIRLDLIKEKLPAEIAFKKTLQNLVKSQLAPVLSRLIAYHLGGKAIAGKERPVNEGDQEKAAPVRVLGGDAVKFSALASAKLSQDWTAGDDWTSYYQKIEADKSVYGALTGATAFDCTNHVATNNLFTSIIDQFLKVFARVVSGAKQSLDETLENCDNHQPHFTLFLAFLRLFEHVRTQVNTLTERHLDFYYREILRLKEKEPQPGHVHLLIELAKQAANHQIKSGELFKAGKDDKGRDTFYANDRNFIANKAKVESLRTIYRHGDEQVLTGIQKRRVFASPKADSDDGRGAEFTSVDRSWHPFSNKTYQGGTLSKINMPQAEMGFALASHYLFMAGGTRTVTVTFVAKNPPGQDKLNHICNSLCCHFTTEKGWLEKPAELKADGISILLTIKLTGSDPAIVPYLTKTHGCNFDTNLPLLLVKFKHQDDVEYQYYDMQDVEVREINLTVDVSGLKTLAASNDFGPVDLSKPFQPFGPQLLAKSALIVGSREVFQKDWTSLKLEIDWKARGRYYPAGSSPSLVAEWLTDGAWTDSKTDSKQNIPIAFIAAIDRSKERKKKAESPGLGESSSTDVVTLPSMALSESRKVELLVPDFSDNSIYDNASSYGFLRLSLDKGFGQKKYQEDLKKYLVNKATNSELAHDPGPGPDIPVIRSIFADYKATQVIKLRDDADAFSQRVARFFHLAPFGQAEQHPYLKSRLPDNEANHPDRAIYLVPQMRHLAAAPDTPSAVRPIPHEAEFLIGVSGLKPPQNLALLIQVAEGSANPLSNGPGQIYWSYLCNNEWISFDPYAVEDRSKGLLNSGVVTFAVPREATDDNTFLPAGMHWLRAAVESQSDGVCRLLLVAAQGLESTFSNHDNDRAFAAQVLPADSISKLDQPTAEIKKISQPFAGFGGRGIETPTAFYTRVSERLRHKDRAISLWDYERLILEEFPQIYRVKCLNHTQYEPNDGIYRELAPGHVTVVTIPDQQSHNLRNPLQPFTSLGLLNDIAAFVNKRVSGFLKNGVNLHVKNPLFEEVRVSCNVRLNEGFDEAFYVKSLRGAITRFLSPWAFGGGSPSFDGKIYKSVLINFIEDQDCVDYVTDFKLFQDLPGSPGVIDLDEVEGTSAVSILVSAPSDRHAITPVTSALVEIPDEKCTCAP